MNKASQLLPDIESVLKYSFPVWTKAPSNIQLVTLQTAIQYNVNMVYYTTESIELMIHETVLYNPSKYSSRWRRLEMKTSWYIREYICLDKDVLKTSSSRQMFAVVTFLKNLYLSFQPSKFISAVANCWGFCQGKQCYDSNHPGKNIVEVIIS